MYLMQDTPDFIINLYTLLHNFAYLSLVICIYYYYFPHINEGFLIWKFIFFFIKL